MSVLDPKRTLEASSRIRLTPVSNWHLLSLLNAKGEMQANENHLAVNSRSITCFGSISTELCFTGLRCIGLRELLQSMQQRQGLRRQLHLA